MVFTFQQGDRPLPGYTIERGVGRGGFGEVYFAKSDGGKEVAVKFLRDNAAIELRGVSQCLNLKSPHLVGIHDIRQSEAGDSYVVMEYVNGPSLRDLMNEHPEGLGTDKAVFFLREICKGLAYLHDCGIVHRDLKPGNIFYEDGYVKIGDYGLAKLMASSQHSGQTVSVGTVHYMAPEVGSGNYDRTIDIYAMGVMLYEMLLGRVPFSGSSMGEVLMKHLTAQPEVDQLPAPFPAVIRKALAKDPKDRYQTVREMMDDIFAVADISQSVASFDTLGLSRMAARVAERVRMDAGARVAVGVGGSSNVHRYPNHTPPPPPPPVIDRPRGASIPEAFDRVGKRFQQMANGGAARLAIEIPDSNGFPQRDRVTTGLLGIFLGPLGIHRFYSGYNTIGILQILVSTFTGIGGLWGIIEGIRILLGYEFRDSMGRPLLGTKPRDPLARSTIIRGFWGILGVIGVLGAMVMSGVAMFAPPEYAEIATHGGDTVYFNPFDFFLCGSCGALALGAFGLWKASHRGSLGIWRATIRPAAMSFAAAVAGSLYVVQRFIAPANAQSLLIAYFCVFVVAFCVLWIIRGDRVPLRASDVYWSRTWMGVFIVVALLSGTFAMKTFRQWHANGRTLENESVSGVIEQVVPRSALPHWTRMRTEQPHPTIQMRNAIFHQEPLLLIAALGLMACSGLEAWHRRSMAFRAAQLASNGNLNTREG